MNLLCFWDQTFQQLTRSLETVKNLEIGPYNLGVPVLVRMKQRKLVVFFQKAANSSDQRHLTFYLGTCTP